MRLQEATGRRKC
ncbi:hypothetical protein GN244_ATG13666 [Phytophthora infestans]|uniref:Uncharacterized protein n=1 Tax=Phytophthora infestans TaxID=4787 RepID=A0A833SZD3_PHYIN|nr:hypothetical protein GN244_ATG13666 [Phytophthora infestans]